MNEDERSNSNGRGADTRPDQHSWQGIAEIDKAIHENRLTEYRWKKAWADPWNRRIGICVFLLFALFVAFVVYVDILKP